MASIYRFHREIVNIPVPHQMRNTTLKIPIFAKRLLCYLGAFGTVPVLSGFPGASARVQTPHLTTHQ